MSPEVLTGRELYQLVANSPCDSYSIFTMDCKYKENENSIKTARKGKRLRVHIFKDYLIRHTGPTDKKPEQRPDQRPDYRLNRIDKPTMAPDTSDSEHLIIQSVKQAPVTKRG